MTDAPYAIVSNAVPGSAPNCTMRSWFSSRSDRTA